MGDLYVQYVHNVRTKFPTYSYLDLYVQRERERERKKRTYGAYVLYAQSRGRKVSNKRSRLTLRVTEAEYRSFKEARLNISHICRKALREAVLERKSGKLVPDKGYGIYSKKQAIAAWNKIQGLIMPITSHRELMEIYGSSYPIREFHHRFVSRIGIKNLDDFMAFINGDEISEEVLQIALKDAIQDYEFQAKSLSEAVKA